MRFAANSIRLAAFTQRPWKAAAMKSILEWSDAFKTGNRDIDIDHQTLFVLVKNLYGQVQNEADTMLIISTSSALEDCVKHQFARQEARMKFCKFGDMDAPLLAHQLLTSQVQQFRMSYEADRSKFDCAELPNFWPAGYPIMSATKT
jgi:hemerythrin-like metal-binding protein